MTNLPRCWKRIGRISRLLPVHETEGRTPIGANDLWIACHALAEDATLMTHDTRKFARVVGLRLEDWVD